MKVFIKKHAELVIGLITFLSFFVLLFIKPIAQDDQYHNFIDDNSLLNVPNFWNVLSNLPFLIVGFLAWVNLRQLKLLKKMKLAYFLFFIGVAFVAFGSGYYHLQPSNETLLWDRLPMTIAFMSLFSIVIAEFIDEDIGKLLLWPLIICGLASVLYWYWGESKGVGDLRYYGVVQFLPMVLIPLILWLYDSNYNKIAGYWWLLGFYVLAKFLEYFDEQIFFLTHQIISGHSLKHVVAALGVYCLLLSYQKRNLKTV